MGQIAALLSPGGRDAYPTLQRMLAHASPRIGDFYGASTEEGTRIATSIPEGRASSSALGYKTVKIQPVDPAQPLEQHGYALAFEGRLWRGDVTSDATTIADILGTEPEKGMESLLARNSSVSLAVLRRGRILFARDPMGHVPLYMGQDGDLAAVASNRKMLWALGMTPETVEPGHVYVFSETGLSSSIGCTIHQPHVAAIATEEAVERLDRLLRGAVRRRCRGASRIALGFSGGIDSGLLAHYMDMAGAEVDLICVGMGGSKEFETAEKAADALDLPLRLEAFTEADIERDLDDVLWSVEEANPMKVAVGLPLYWAARSASESGCRVFISGNGSDELFGGYQKYAREYREGGDRVREAMFTDVARSHEVNFERDYKICSDLGLELRVPYADIEVVRFGLSLPTCLKLSREPGSPRKLILRKLAEKQGLPEEISGRRKKAVQYSTGVSKALTRIAKAEGESLAGYLKERFRRVKAERLREAGP